MSTTRQRLLAASSLSAFCVLGAPTAQGGSSDAYFGVGAGVADLEDQVVHTETGPITLDRRDTTYKVFGGYQATDSFAVEGTYRDFGESEEGPFRTETDGLDVSAVGMLLIGPVDVFARGGVIFWDTNGRGGLSDDHGEDLSWGVGGALKLGDAWFRVEGEWFDVELPGDVQTVTASVAWSF